MNRGRALECRDRGFDLTYEELKLRCCNRFPILEKASFDLTYEELKPPFKF